MMKLRIRSLETRETLKIEVPFQCSLQQLGQILSQKLSSSSNSSPTPPDSIRFSLNKADEIHSSAPEEDNLQSLGITSGDLIFYTIKTNPSVVSSETLIPISQVTVPVPAQNSGLNLGHEDRQQASLIELQDARSVSNAEPNLRLLHPVSIPDQNSDINHDPSLMESQNPKGADLNLPCQQDHQSEKMKCDVDSEEASLENMEIDEGDGDGDVDVLAMEDTGKSFSVPGFLRKVFTDELGGDDGGSRKHKLVVIAIHAVLLESGFVVFDMDSKTVVKGFQFRNGWPVNAFRLSLFYTLPEIIMDASPSLEPHNCAFILKFQSVGKYMNVYGSLGSGSATHSVRLNEDELVSFFNVVWANCCVRDDIVTSEGRILETSPEKEVFKFWKTVKDNLALPLLIDLCEKAGFELPPCFTRLPTDLKLKIVELLPGLDVARISCVSSELRYLASSNDLWMQKYVEQFGEASTLDEKGLWKEKFARFFIRRKRKKISCGSFRTYRLMCPPTQRRPRVPHIIRGGPPILWLSGNQHILGSPANIYPSSEGQGIRYQSSSQFPSFGNV